MSFAMGFAKGAAETVNERIDENRSKADEKRKYYRNLMYEQALPAYYKKKAMASEYRKGVDNLRALSIGESDEIRRRAINFSGGDINKAAEWIAENRPRMATENTGDPQRTRNMALEAGGGPSKQAASMMQGATQTGSGFAPMQQPQVPQDLSQGVSGAPRDVQKEQGGPNFFGRLLGQEGNHEIRNEVAREVQSDLGLDEQTFSGMMEQAFTPYGGLETGEGRVKLNPEKDSLAKTSIENVYNLVTKQKMDPPEGMSRDEYLSQLDEAMRSGNTELMHRTASVANLSPDSHSELRKLKDRAIKGGIDSLSTQDKVSLILLGGTDPVVLDMIQDGYFDELTGANRSDGNLDEGNRTGDGVPTGIPGEQSGNEGSTPEASMEEVQEFVERRNQIDDDDSEAAQKFIKQVEDKFGSMENFLSAYEYYGGNIEK